MSRLKQLDIKIDKLTRSIENAISGDSFKTEILPATKSDMTKLKAKDWFFDWKSEAKETSKTVYKLVILDNPNIIQGLVSIEDRMDHFFMHLIESNKFNRGSRKLYLGVPGNLVAFACKRSFLLGYNGYVSFESKTRLISHYQKTLGAKILFGNFMVLDSFASTKLVTQYFPDFL